MSMLTQVTKQSRSSFRSSEEDYISKLPESVVIQILSCLPTKDAVRTSVLSKDWEYKWHSLYNINIDDKERASVRRRSNKTSFMNFLNKVLFLTHEIRSFRLSCRCHYDNGLLEGWMASLLKYNIECLELRALESIAFLLPRSLLNKTSLKILKLKSFCTFKVPADNHFPNLTYLHLKSVRINTKFSNTLFTFPVLKTLKVKKCVWLNASLVEIRAPALSRFVYETAWKAGDYSIKISGARLERFKSTGSFPDNIILYDTTVLESVFLNNPGCECTKEESVSNAQNLVGLFSSATALVLSQWTYKVMVLAEQELLLPKYDKLQRLVMCLWRDTKLLFELLHSAPSLKYLEIYGNWEGLSHDEVDNVPHCVASHLEELEFVSINEKPLSDLAFFFLTNGVVLKKVRIINEFPDNVRLVEEVLKYPRASSHVEIVIR